MQVKIIETGEIKHLSIIDPKSGVNWINDLMGNHDALPEIEIVDGWKTDNYLMTKDDFDWWEGVAAAYESANERYYDLLLSLPDEQREELEQAANELAVDLEDLPGALNELCNQYEEED